MSSEGKRAVNVFITDLYSKICKQFMAFREWEANDHKAWTQIENNFVAKDFRFCRCSNSAVIPLEGKKLFSTLSTKYVGTYNLVFVASWSSITIWHPLPPKENETLCIMTNILLTCVYLQKFYYKSELKILEKYIVDDGFVHKLAD